MWMNVPTGTMAALLVVKTSQDPISVPALKGMPSYQTGKHAKVKWKHICTIYIDHVIWCMKILSFYVMMFLAVVRTNNGTQKIRCRLSLLSVKSISTGSLLWIDKLKILHIFPSVIVKIAKHTLCSCFLFFVLCGTVQCTVELHNKLRKKK